ncbi:MAG: hypothetical protein P4L80_05120 [Xanthobacteraceae bacterium]|nr:hypothetical protein [Xanthobacteraceae bacterium]
MKTIFTVVTALVAAALAGTVTGASAQVLNLSGQFQCVQRCVTGPPALTYVTQGDWNMNLVNEAGAPARGWIDWPGHIWVDTWREGAIYSPDGMTIQFDSGTVWQRIVGALVPPPYWVR